MSLWPREVHYYHYQSMVGQPKIEREVISGGKLVVALFELRVEVAAHVTSTGEDGGEEEVSIVDNNSLGGAGISRTIESCSYSM